MRGDTCGLADRTREIEIMMRKVSKLNGGHRGLTSKLDSTDLHVDINHKVAVHPAQHQINIEFSFRESIPV